MALKIPRCITLDVGKGYQYDVDQDGNVYHGNVNDDFRKIGTLRPSGLTNTKQVKSCIEFEPDSFCPTALGLKNIVKLLEMVDEALSEV